MKLTELRQRLRQGMLPEADPNPRVRFPDNVPTVVQESFGAKLDRNGLGPRSASPPGSRIVKSLIPSDGLGALDVWLLDTREFNITMATTADDIERYDGRRGDPVRLGNVRLDSLALRADDVESTTFATSCVVTGWALIEVASRLIIAWQVMDERTWIHTTPGLSISLSWPPTGVVRMA